MAQTYDGQLSYQQATPPEHASAWRSGSGPLETGYESYEPAYQESSFERSAGAEPLYSPLLSDAADEAPAGAFAPPRLDEGVVLPPHGLGRSEPSGPTAPTARAATTDGAALGLAPRMALPAAPASIAEADLDPQMLQELALKHLAAATILSGSELAERLRLPVAGVVEEVVAVLRREALVELLSGGNAILGIAGMRMRATERGATVARAVSEHNSYLGPAPVSLRAYLSVYGQPNARLHGVASAGVRQAVEHLVLAPDMADRLGTGIESGGPILLTGAPGNGKTALASSIASMLASGTYVPYAIAVEDSIVPVFDANVHELMSGSVGRDADKRWAFCRRPFVRVGAELQARALELTFNPQSHTYECPLQIRAGGGVLLLDDLGAQHDSAADLLNRCLEPALTGIDYLTTYSGTRIPAPFTALLVLAASGDLAAMFGESLLRRLPCKVQLPDPSQEQFRELFRRACRAADVEYTDSGVEYIIEACYIRPRRVPRAAHPAELLRLICAAARYAGVTPQLAPDLIEMAASLYFL